MSRFLRNITLWLCALALCGSVSAPASANPAARLVRYRGVALHVPGGWPVFHLSPSSQTCVRFNRHAIYLGTPGSDQRCPAFSVGHTEAVLVEPVARPAASVAPGTQLRETLPVQGVVISASWSQHPGVIARVLGRAHVSAPRGGADAVAAPASTLAAPARAAPDRAPRAAARRAHAASAPYTGLGFDACSAPSARTMARWSSSPFRTVGVYLGGVNSACAQPNLTPWWVRTQIAAGWHLILTYVGLQAPRNSCGCAAIATARAAQEGRAAARDAVAHAAAIGIGPRASIYFDMEAYASTARTRAAVVAFLGAWTRQLHAQGYRSGVYSSAASGVADLIARLGMSFAEPDSLWFADWNREANVAAPYIPVGAWARQQLVHQYSGDHRVSYGGATLDIDSDYLEAGTTGSPTALSGSLPGLSIGPLPAPAPAAALAGAGSATPAAAAPAGAGSGTPAGAIPATPATPSTSGSGSGSPPSGAKPRLTDGMLVEVSGTGAVYRLAGHAPLFVRYWDDVGGAQTPTMVSQHQFGTLASAPADGTLLSTITGATYVIAGGYPFPVPASDLPPGSQPVLIDAWDLVNLADPMAHLNATPSDGTVVEGVPSGASWVFESGVLAPSKSSGSAVLVADGALSMWRTTLRR